MRVSAHPLSAAQHRSPVAHRLAGYAPSLFCIHGSLGGLQVLKTRRAKISHYGLGCSGSKQAGFAAVDKIRAPRPAFLQWLSQWLSLRIVLGQRGRVRNYFSFGAGFAASASILFSEILLPSTHLHSAIRLFNSRTSPANTTALSLRAASLPVRPLSRVFSRLEDRK